MNGSDVTSTIDGTIELTGELRPSPAPLTGNHTFVGSAELVGRANSAQILLDVQTLRGLISSITTRCVLEIGHLDLDDVRLILKGGTLHADANGTFRMCVSILEDESAASPSLLKVSSHPGAVMLIELSCNTDDPLIPCVLPCLEFTNVEVLLGTLHLNDEVPLLTKGTLPMDRGGIIKVDQTVATFLFQGICMPN